MSHRICSRIRYEADERSRKATMRPNPRWFNMVKGYSVMGVFWGSFTLHQPKEFADNMKELLIWYVQGKVKVIVDEVVPLANAKDALNKVMNREVKGKMTLRP